MSILYFRLLSFFNCFTEQWHGSFARSPFRHFGQSEANKRLLKELVADQKTF
jgi:hypothetical protein